jgi:molybdopterin adenylyltransferase
MATSNPTIKAVVLTISDSAARGERTDLSGPAVVAELQKLNAELAATEILPDERTQIAERLRHYADAGLVNLIVTTGGTGLAPRDITPEATRDVIEREAPGLAELMRQESLKITPLAALSRAVCGVRGRIDRQCARQRARRTRKSGRPCAHATPRDCAFE